MREINYKRGEKVYYLYPKFSVRNPGEKTPTFLTIYGLKKGEYLEESDDMERARIIPHLKNNSIEVRWEQIERDKKQAEELLEVVNSSNLQSILMLIASHEEKLDRLNKKLKEISIILA